MAGVSGNKALPESKGKFRSRLEKMGLWERCVERRDYLKAEGCSAAEYWRIIMNEYSPGRCIEMLGLSKPEPHPGAIAFGLVDPPSSEDAPTVGVSLAPNGMPLVPAKTWDGRPSITFEEAVLWADAHRAIAGLKPEDCPDGVSYEKLWGAQNSMEGSKYLDSLVSKIASKRKSGDDDIVDIEAYTDQLIKMIEDSRAETIAAGGE